MPAAIIDLDASWENAPAAALRNNPPDHRRAGPSAPLPGVDAVVQRRAREMYADHFAQYQLGFDGLPACSLQRQQQAEPALETDRACRNARGADQARRRHLQAD